jgi:cytidylate kinase
LIVTIDGPVAAGKTTVARELASRLGFTLLDTGAIYRSLALVARARGVSQDDEEGLAELARDLGVSFEWRDGQNHVFVDGVDVTVEIRLPEVSQAASIVSALPGVRQALLDRQRQLAAEGSVVAEGRDTGTVVFPDAEAKFFVTADDLVRAERRQRELLEKGGSDTLEEVLAALKERDLRDSTRAVAPLKPASDARIIDTTGRTIEEVLAEILEYIAA